MKRELVSGLVLAAAIGLSACGGAGGGGDLAGRLTGICIEERGEADRTACECAARVVNESLTDEDRKLALLSVDAEEGRFKTQDDARKAMSSIGLNPDNAEQIMSGFVMRMMTVEATATAKCGP